MMTVRGKLGTHSSNIYKVKGKQRVLKLGERVEIKSDSDPRVYKWSVARIDQINDDGFTFFYLV